MRVTVKFLSTYREYLPDGAGGNPFFVEIPAGTRVDGLLSQVPIPPDETKVVLVNGRTPLDGQVLAEGDTIAIFPAMAGG